MLGGLGAPVRKFGWVLGGVGAPDSKFGWVLGGLGAPTQHPGAPWVQIGWIFALVKLRKILRNLLKFHYLNFQTLRLSGCSILGLFRFCGPSIPIIFKILENFFQFWNFFFNFWMNLSKKR